MSEPADTCRADVWLWRARFLKTRALACRMIEAGRVRLTRDGRESRLDKPSRPLRPGDRLVFALGGRLVAVQVEAMGDRRGPAGEARGLYSAMDDETGGQPAELGAERDRRAGLSEPRL